MDEDFKLALQLQEQFNRESENDPVTAFSNVGTTNGDYILALQLQEELSKESKETEGLSSQPLNENAKTSIIDKFWELNDPNPDIHGLFLEFNRSYFWNKLQGIEVRWSNRMTLCAGLCCYEGHGGLCSIRLSLPLLKLRPRKDLVETLLHEMIHAFLFVTHNNRDHDAHGPEFLKHMYRINKLTGANITVCHNFHDEVNEYRQHWWRCNGPCRHRPPYYGIVRRAMNRAPSANDFWWEEHKMTCGGTYEKIKEPEANNMKRKGTEKANGIGKKVKTENIKKYVSLRDENKFTSQSASRHSYTVSTTVTKNSPRNTRTLVSPIKGTKNSKLVPFSGKGNTLGSSSPLQDVNGVNKKTCTLLSYLQSNKSIPGKHSYSRTKTEVPREKELSISSMKKQPAANSESIARPSDRLLLPNEQETISTPNFRTQTKIDDIWHKAANTSISPRLKERIPEKKFLPAGMFSTASPLNHVKKIFMNDDDNDESLHDWSVPDTIVSKKSVQEKKFPSNTQSFENAVLLDSDDDSSANNATNTVICPACNLEIKNAEINSHLDHCLSN